MQVNALSLFTDVYFRTFSRQPVVDHRVCIEFVNADIPVFQDREFKHIFCQGGDLTGAHLIALERVSFLFPVENVAIQDLIEPGIDRQSGGLSVPNQVDPVAVFGFSLIFLVHPFADIKILSVSQDLIGIKAYG